MIYIPGNHDEFVSRFYGDYGNITIQQQAIHTTADGRRMLVIHGHELDTVVQNVRWLAFAGDVGYQFLLSLNPAINFVRRRFGFGYWSLSAYVKKRVKDAVSFIGEFEKAIVRYAADHSSTRFSAATSTARPSGRSATVTYYNCGDWVETCSALVENDDGRIELVHCHGMPGAPVAAAKDHCPLARLGMTKERKRNGENAGDASPVKMLKSEMKDLQRDLRLTLRAYALGLETDLEEKRGGGRSLCARGRTLARKPA